MTANNDSVRVWLNNAGRYPLLRPEEVLRLARIVQDEDSSEKEKNRALDKIVKCNLRLIPNIVRRTLASKKTFRFGDPFTVDLFQAATIGLHRAAQKFDPTLGYAFSTYAAGWIFQAVQREIMNNMSMIRVPETTQRDYYNSLDRGKIDPTLDKKVRQRLESAANALACRSLSSISTDPDMEEPLERYITRQSDDLEASDSFEELLDLIKLNELEKRLMTLIFDKSMHRIQAGRELGLKPDRARRIYEKSINQLREIITR